MSLGISWHDTAQEYANMKTQKYRYAQTNGANGYANQQSAVSIKGNTCTDGKDDGKIGILSAIGNTIQGAGKGIVNAVKGMFTDANGNISPLKTLGTIALGAACVAFPPLGVGLCAFGAVTGGIKLATGISKAVSAETDAEAKDAWEAVGDGGATVALSALGGKASMKAVKVSAGEASELAKLGETATRMEKLSALGKDMVTSSRNNASKIKTSASNLTEAFKIQKLRKTTSKFEGTPTDKELALQRELEIRTGKLGNKDAIEIADNLEARSQASQAAKTAVKDAKSDVASAKEVLNKAKKSGVEEEIESATTKLEDAKRALKEAQSKTTFGKIKSQIPEANLKNIAENLKNIKDGAKFKSIKSTLSTKKQAVIDFLTTEEGKYAEAVQKFGYKDVLEALEVFASYRMLDESV